MQDFSLVEKDLWEAADQLRTNSNLASSEDFMSLLGVNFATINRWKNAKTVSFRLGRAQFETFCEWMKEQGKLKHGQD